MRKKKGLMHNFQKHLKTSPAYDEIQELIGYETALTLEIASGDRWANGTLDDGSFDIIVDFNVIDVILFGDDAALPPPRIAGKVQEDSNYSRAPRYGDLVDPLLFPPLLGDDGGNGDGDGGDGGDGDGDGGDGDGDGDGGDGDGGDGDGDGDSGPMCVDPEALFLAEQDQSEGGSGEIEGEDSDSDSSDPSEDEEGDSAGVGNEGEGSNVSDPIEELPDFAGEEDGYIRGEYPNLDDIEEDEGCEGEEIPVFNGMLCLPQFCDDILCVFTEIRPGRTFTLASVETPACIECIVRKGVEILETMEKTVETPQCTNKKGYGIRKRLFGGGEIDFQAIPKPLPFLRYKTPDQTRPPSAILQDAQTAVLGQAEFSNFELAKEILSDDCSAILRLYPSNAVVSAQELFDQCTEDKEQKRLKTIGKLMSSHGGAPSTIESYQALERGNEFVVAVYQELYYLRANMESFTRAVQTLTPKNIKDVDVRCK